MDLLREAGAEVAYYDPYVPVIRLTREHPHWAGTKSVQWEQSVVSKFDAVLIATAHANVDYGQLVRLVAVGRRYSQCDSQAPAQQQSRLGLTHRTAICWQSSFSHS